jgi:hypothetical protein
MIWWRGSGRGFERRRPGMDHVVVGQAVIAGAEAGKPMNGIKPEP